MKRITTMIIALLTFTLFVASCAPETKKKPEDLVQVVTTFDAITEYVKAVGGDRVEVRSLVPSGAGAHGFEPRAKDLLVLQDADLFVLNGLTMEPWAERAVQSVTNDKLIVVDTSVGVDTIALLDGEHDHDHEEEHEHDDEHGDEHDDEDEHDHEHGDYDPHIWLGLSTAIKQVENVRDALIDFDQAGKSVYEANATRFTDQLRALLTEYEPKFAALENDVFVTGHAAFAYLCRDFGLTQLSVQNVFADGEPSAKQLIELVEFSREHGVKTIFAESMASPEVSRTLAAEVGAEVKTIYTMETGEDDKTYLERVEANLASILAALQE